MPTATNITVLLLSLRYTNVFMT